MASDNSQAQAAFGAPETPRAPSRAWYVAGALLCGAAVVGAVLWFVLGLVGMSHAIGDLDRVPIPGTGAVTLGHGRQAIYYEGPGGSDATVPALRIAIRGIDDGPALAVGHHAGSVSYDMGGHAGRSVAGFSTPRAGQYQVRVTFVDGSGPRAHLAIGHGVGGRIVRAIVGAIVIFLGGGGLGAAVIGVTATRRGRAGRT